MNLKFSFYHIDKVKSIKIFLWTLKLHKSIYTLWSLIL